LLDDGGVSGTDASGNPILKDIGPFLKNEMKKYAPLKVRSYAVPA
jgi:6-phosphofructokinase 1